MKNIILFVCLVVSLSKVIVFAQENKVDILVKDGISLHDKGQYQEAIEKYQQAIRLDSLNYLAKTEMAMTYCSLEEYQKSADICQDIVEHCGNDNILKNNTCNLWDSPEAFGAF